jgi:uncharacterized protein (DUF433 family)
VELRNHKTAHRLLGEGGRVSNHGRGLGKTCTVTNSSGDQKLDGRLWIYPIERAIMHGMKKWIVEDEKHLAGAPRIRGTRIAVSLLLESFAAGMSIREIVDAYPSLTEDAVRGALEQLAREQRKAA